MDGIIVVDKPQGITSHQVVQSIRRLFPGVKAGHSGTLDPMATGVLPVCLGRATRITEYIIEHPKTYRAAVTLGKITDTEDSEGMITGTCEVPVLKKDRVEEILSRFLGQIEQVAPLYSAIKYQGKPLYHWTRKGKEVPRKTRIASIYRIELLKFNPDSEPQLVFDVECSKGTYIRTLAVDIGKAVGCGGHLGSLARLAVGPFKLENSFKPEIIEKLRRDDQLEELIKPMDYALTMIPAIFIDHERIIALKNGRVVELGLAETEASSDFMAGQDRQSNSVPISKARVYNREGSFKALARVEKIGAGVRLRTLKYLSD